MDESVAVGSPQWVSQWASLAANNTRTDPEGSGAEPTTFVHQERGIWLCVNEYHSMLLLLWIERLKRIVFSSVRYILNECFVQRKLTMTMDQIIYLHLI